MKRLLTAFLAVLLCLSLSACAAIRSVLPFDLPDFSGSGSPAPEKTSVRGKLDENGNAYLPLMDGTAVRYRGDFAGTWITPDRRHVVALKIDGSLYAADARHPDDLSLIAKQVEYMGLVRDSGVLVQDADDSLVRIFFDGERPNVKVIDEEYDTGNFAPNSLTVIMGGEKGLYILRESEDEPERISAVNGEVYAAYVSDDGKTAVWKEQKGEKATLYLYANGEKNKIADVDGSRRYCSVSAKPDGSLIVIMDPDSETVWFVRAGDTEATSVRLGPGISAPMTASGFLGADTSKKTDWLYFRVNGSSGSTVYAVDMEGNKERLVSRESPLIAGGYLFYEEDGDLYAAPLKGSELGEEVRIASDVDSGKVSLDGRYVYYWKDYDRYEGTLYRYDVKKDESERISGSAAYEGARVDGASILFFEDVEDGYGCRIGTLKISAAGKDTVRVSSDVILSSPESGCVRDYNYADPVDAKGFYFLKYVSEGSNADGMPEAVANLMYFNGKETETLARDVFMDSEQRATEVD